MGNTLSIVYPQPRVKKKRGNNATSAELTPPGATRHLKLICLK
jgi:hypothetical protein